MTSGKIVWENLPTVVRRKFGDYLMRAQGKFPQAVFQRTGEPWREDKYIVIPYTDRRSGAIYEAVATEDGTVLETRDREAVNAEQVRCDASPPTPRPNASKSPPLRATSSEPPTPGERSPAQPRLDASR